MEPKFHLSRLEHERTKTDYIFCRFPRIGGRNDGTLLLLAADALDAKKLSRELNNLGAKFPDGASFVPTCTKLIEQISEQVGTLTDSPGWKEEAGIRYFVMPDKTYWPEKALKEVQVEEAATERCLARRVGGTLAEWKTQVAQLAAGSPHASIAILASLAAPLHYWSSIKEGFVLNFPGASSTGKTTANQCAASVWGDPSDSGTWNATPRHLVERAVSNNDIVLILDDAEQADTDIAKRMATIHEYTHLLAGGRSKGYARSVSGQLPDYTFRNIVLSSSPVPIEDRMRDRGIERTNGDRARSLEIPVLSDGGIWRKIDGSSGPESPGQLSDFLVTACKQQFGTAGRAWIEYLVSEQAQLGALVARYTAKFRERSKVNDGVEGRIADKIALLLAAGQLAIKAGILPWDKSHLKNVTRFALEQVLVTARQREPLTAHELLGKFLKTLYRDNNIEKARSVREARVPLVIPLIVGESLFMPQRAFESALHTEAEPLSISAQDLKMIYDVLRDNKIMAPGEGSTNTKTIRFRGNTKARVLQIN
ncbi:DUF927 domain-containing protein [Paradevosia shaoguanensis]